MQIENFGLMSDVFGIFQKLKYWNRKQQDDSGDLTLFLQSGMLMLVQPVSAACGHTQAS
ncbi:MAG: hypothetical protein HQ557_19810 [Bacteroidetes bacterium]|nr:hypothetical protein [Bacteroidota bacterium]